MGTYLARNRLPTNYYTNIGRIVSRFALIELAVQHIIYALIEVNPKLGRVAIKSPRLNDSFAMISDLLMLRGFTSSIDLKELAEACKIIETFRDKVAHGVWFSHPQSTHPVLRVTAGSYVKKQGEKSVKARISPQGLKILPTDFKAFLSGTQGALRDLKKLAGDLRRQQRASHKKSLAQLAQKGSPQRPRRIRTRKVPPPPLQS